MSDWAPYAADPAHSRGRAFAVDGSASRSEFQRDRDRIIHSAAFRRLQHKTQVFLQHEGHHFRTRLTHTLEVAQIARSLARALRLNEDLAEAVALSHDLGHTPFGHAGERVLNAKMRAYGGFDHNVQALRLVTMLENRYAAHDGLNLTWETLEGIFKHNGPLTDAGGQPVGKYADEGLPTGIEAIPAAEDLQIWTFPSLEAQLAALADDIAYNAHDIDDAVRAGILSLDALAEVPLAGPIVKEVFSLWPDINASRQRHEVQRRLITRVIVDVIDSSKKRLRTTKPQSSDDVRQAGDALASFSPQMAADVVALKGFLFANVYRAEPVMAHVRRSEEVVGALFDKLMGGEGFPKQWNDAFNASETEQRRARIVCDYLSGMTDPYALDLYAQLFDARPEFR